MKQEELVKAIGTVIDYYECQARNTGDPSERGTCYWMSELLRARQQSLMSAQPSDVQEGRDEAEAKKIPCQLLPTGPGGWSFCACGAKTGPTGTFTKQREWYREHRRKVRAAQARQ